MEPVANLLDLDLDCEIEYPTSDGRPMAETDTHREQMVALIKALKYYFRDQPTTYISGNILMYYEKGNKRKHRAPDVLVAFGIGNEDRDYYQTWVEGKAPDLVFEITSRSTRAEDLGEKKGLYAFLGVKEYVIFDPLEEYLEPRLRLYRLAGEEYLPVTGNPLRLSTMDVELEILGGKLRLRSTSTNELLLTPEERAEQQTHLAEQQAQLAEQQRIRAEKAESELRKLRAQLGETPR